MQYKAIPFINLIADEENLTLEPDDFLNIIDEEGFVIDEADEAEALMDEEELRSIEEFEKQYCQ